MKTTCAFLLFFALGNVYAADLEVSIPDGFVLPDVTTDLPILTEREAQITPQEYVIASRIQSLLSVDDYEAAVDMIDRQINTDAEEPYSVFSPALNLVIGSIYQTVNRDDAGEKALLAAIKGLPQFVRAHNSLGMLYLRAERYEEAQLHLSQAVASGGMTAELAGYLGYVNQQIGNYWGAVGAYQQASMMEPDNIQWQQGLLFSLIQSGQLQSALALLEELLVDYETDATLWLYRAQLALRNNNDEVALTSLEMALRLGDTSLANMQTCAQLHIRLGSIPRAIELLSASLEPGLDYVIINQILTALVRDERWEYAEELIEEIKPQWDQLNDTEQSRLLYHEARVDVANERMVDATSALEQSTTLDPNNADAILHLADIYARGNRYIQAELMYERATAFDSTRGKALLGHAQVAVDQFDYQAALDLLREATAIYPRQFELLENIRILENIIATSQN